MVLFFCSKCCVCLLHYIYKGLPPPLPHSIHPFGVAGVLSEWFQNSTLPLAPLQRTTYTPAGWLRVAAVPLYTWRPCMS